MSKTQQTAGEKPRIGEQEVRRAAELLKKYRQGKVNLERRIIDNEQFWKLRHWPQMEKTGEGGNPGDPQTLWTATRSQRCCPESRGTGRRRPS